MLTTDNCGPYIGPDVDSGAPDTPSDDPLEQMASAVIEIEVLVARARDLVDQARRGTIDYEEAVDRLDAVLADIAGEAFNGTQLAD